MVHTLVTAARKLPLNKGFASALYFSFVTATSIGYGDIVPVGGARVIAVAEAITALLVFGAVVAKFVSHRQEELVSEIHRFTFEERLDRSALSAKSPRHARICRHLQIVVKQYRLCGGAE